MQGHHPMGKMMRRLENVAVPHGFRSSFRDWAAERTEAPREARDSPRRASTATVSRPRIAAAICSSAAGRSCKMGRPHRRSGLDTTVQDGLNHRHATRGECRIEIRSQRVFGGRRTHLVGADEPQLEAGTRLLLPENESRIVASRRRERTPDPLGSIDVRQTLPSIRARRAPYPVKGRLAKKRTSTLTRSCKPCDPGMGTAVCSVGQNTSRSAGCESYVVNTSASSRVIAA